MKSFQNWKALLKKHLELKIKLKKIELKKKKNPHAGAADGTLRRLNETNTGLSDNLEC